MDFHGNGISRNENTVSSEKMNHFVFFKRNASAAGGTEQYLEGKAGGMKADHTAETFCVYKHPFHLKIFTAA